MDALDEAGRAAEEAAASRHDTRVLLSAETGEGCDALMLSVDEALGEADRVEDVSLSFSDGAALAWLKANAEVITEEGTDSGYKLTVSIDPLAWSRFEKRFKGGVTRVKEDWER